MSSKMNHSLRGQQVTVKMNNGEYTLAKVIDVHMVTYLIETKAGARHNVFSFQII